MSDSKRARRTFGMRMYLLFSCLVRFFMRIHVTGKENLPQNGGAVICANHISLADPIAVAVACPRRMTFLAKKELFRVPLLRHVIRVFGAKPLDRRGDVSAMKSAMSAASGGGLILIFPQGTRRPGVNPAETPVKSGAGMIASHAAVPMVPVCVRMKHERFRFFRRIDVIIGVPLSPEELGLTDGETNSATYTAATHRVFEELCRLGGYLPGTGARDGGMSQ